jgi:hypothetical protein
MKSAIRLTRSDLDALHQLKTKVLLVTQVTRWRSLARRQLITIELGPRPWDDALCCLITQRGRDALAHAAEDRRGRR